MTGRMILAALVIAASGFSSATDQRRAKPATHTITIDATRFQPEALTVKAGDAVVWINKDVIPHTATSEAARFDSGTITAGASWKTVLKAKGDFAYVCLFHPTMKAKIRVE